MLMVDVFWQSELAYCMSYLSHVGDICLHNIAFFACFAVRLMLQTAIAKTTSIAQVLEQNGFRPCSADCLVSYGSSDHAVPDRGQLKNLSRGCEAYAEAALHLSSRVVFILV